MPKQGPSLSSNGEVVCVCLVCLNWTLCNICWSIRPTTCLLPDSMPEKNSKITTYSQLRPTGRRPLYKGYRGLCNAKQIITETSKNILYTSGYVVQLKIK